MNDFRWTSKHRWKRASNIAYTSIPVQYDWKCERCGQAVLANKPPDSECYPQPEASA